jgi:hypothetical protein
LLRAPLQGHRTHLGKDAWRRQAPPLLPFLPCPRAAPRARLGAPPNSRPPQSPCWPRTDALPYLQCRWALAAASGGRPSTPTMGMACCGRPWLPPLPWRAAPLSFPNLYLSRTLILTYAPPVPRGGLPGAAQRSTAPRLQWGPAHTGPGAAACCRRDGKKNRLCAKTRRAAPAPLRTSQVSM